MAVHDLRCEWSRTKPSRCRCGECGGRRHGIQAQRADMLQALAHEAITEDEYTDWLERTQATGVTR
jgi:ribosomal protein L34E